MSSKSAKKSEQRRSNQQQDSAQASQSKQHNQPPVQGEQPQPPQKQVQPPASQNEPPQVQPEQQAQPAAALPPQTFQNQTAQYVVFNYSKKGTVIGQSVAYGIGLFFSVGFAAQLLSMNTSIEKFTDVSSYFFIQSVKVFMSVVLGILIIGSIGLWITYLSNRDKNIAKVAAFYIDSFFCYVMALLEFLCCRRFRRCSILSFAYTFWCNDFGNCLVY